MDFELTPEQALMIESARKVVLRHIAPVLEATGAHTPLPKPELLTAFEHLAVLGLTSARLRDRGQAAMRMLDYGMMFEQIPPAVALSFMAHEATLARLDAECTAPQRQRFLPDLIAARKIACLGSTEPDTGSDPRGVKTRLTRRRGGLVLDGHKMWITNVSACDVILVTCRDCREHEDASTVIKVVLERDVTPFEARDIETTGLRQGRLGEAVFENCAVPPENVIESAKGGTEVLKSSWAVNRPLLGLLAVQIAQRAYDIAADYAAVRKQFGKALNAFQLVQKNLSDIVTAVTASRLLCYHALAAIDRGEAAAGISAMAKRYAQNACRDAVWQAMNTLGALGLSTEARIESLYRDVCMLAVPDGTNEILALIHGRELTGVEAIRGGGAT
ncbi:MAG: acyl-CoA dehydrogenase family protein [Burkholderiales bacterium]